MIKRLRNRWNDRTLSAPLNTIQRMVPRLLIADMIERP
jgi:hypothetical protein